MEGIFTVEADREPRSVGCGRCSDILAARADLQVVTPSTVLDRQQSMPFLKLRIIDLGEIEQLEFGPTPKDAATVASDVDEELRAVVLEDPQFPAGERRTMGAVMREVTPA